jgi:hypothetical protein
MASNSVLVQRLIAEFGAQDCSTTMKVFYKGEHILVARFIEDQQEWAVTPEGMELLNPTPKLPDAPAAPDTPSAKPANISVAAPKKA